MRLFGFEIARTQKALQPARSDFGSWLWSSVREPFAGAWQRNITADKRENLLAFSAVFACIALIAEDIAKLRPRVMEQNADGTWTEVNRNTPFAAVLRKPNRTRRAYSFS